jgi:hypothetical protein
VSLPSPLYTATIECDEPLAVSAEVVQAEVALLLPACQVTDTEVHSALPLSVNVIVPRGTTAPLGGVTVAVKVTESSTDEVGGKPAEDEATVVVVLALLTVCDNGVAVLSLLLWFESPKYPATIECGEPLAVSAEVVQVAVALPVEVL